MRPVSAGPDRPRFESCIVLVRLEARLIEAFKSNQLGLDSKQLAFKTTQLGLKSKQLGLKSKKLGFKSKQLGFKTTQLRFKRRHQRHRRAPYLPLPTLVHGPHRLRYPLGRQIHTLLCLVRGSVSVAGRRVENEDEARLPRAREKGGYADKTGETEPLNATDNHTKFNTA
jgi:hypothetical protein